MKVSVIVCTRNRPESIEPCISSILNNTYRDLELLIIDQSNDGKTEEVVKKHMDIDKRIEYIHLNTEGKSKAVNLGIKRSSGDIVTMTDDDCVVKNDWIENIVEAFQKNPDVAVVCGSVLDDTALVGKKRARRLIKDRELSGRLSKLFFIADGANISVKKSIFKITKGFDIFLGPGTPLLSSEDQDFAYRVLKAGFRILCVKKIIVTHYLSSHVKNFHDLTSSIRGTTISLAAWLFKHIRCLDPIAALILFVVVIDRTSRAIWYTIFERFPVKQPRFLLTLSASFLFPYWFLLGVLKSLKYSVDKSHCLFIPN